MTRQLLLIGAGHAHAFVLEAFALHPDNAVSITVVSDNPFAAYSGSVPAWLSGECTLRETQMDIAVLCQRAGARFIASPAVALSTSERQVTLVDGSVISVTHLFKAVPAHKVAVAARRLHVAAQQVLLVGQQVAGVRDRDDRALRDDLGGAVDDEALADAGVHADDRGDDEEFATPATRISSPASCAGRLDATHNFLKRRDGEIARSAAMPSAKEQVMIDVKHYLYHRGSGKSNAAKEQGKAHYELYKATLDFGAELLRIGR